MCNKIEIRCMKQVRDILCVVCSLVVLIACSSDDDIAGSSLHAIARQNADAVVQCQEEMPLFSLSDIESFNIETGEITFYHFVFDTHLFWGGYRVCFYDGDVLLFDAVPVSWFDSRGYFDQLTFQCDFYGPDDMWDATKSHFYLRYGYPGTIKGDKTIEELKQKNAAGMDRFIQILRWAGKIGDAYPEYMLNGLRRTDWQM